MCICFFPLPQVPADASGTAFSSADSDAAPDDGEGVPLQLSEEDIVSAFQEGVSEEVTAESNIPYRFRGAGGGGGVVLTYPCPVFFAGHTL